MQTYCSAPGGLGEEKEMPNMPTWMVKAAASDLLFVARSEPCRRPIFPTDQIWADRPLKGVLRQVGLEACSLALGGPPVYAYTLPVSRHRCATVTVS